MLCRISLSCRQLTETEMPVGQIAEEAGFHDMSNFSRAFKTVIGMTPSQFRKRNRHGETSVPFPEK
jgi:two-component system response regulator YesN